MHRPHPIALLVPALALAFVVGCTESPRLDAGPGVDAGTDAGPVDAGDGKCHGDLDCPGNQYCELATGVCIDAKACKSDGDCTYQLTADDDYCANGACFCDLERNGGSCRPRFKPCQTCTRDVECGSDAFIFDDYVAKCTEYQGEKTCMPLKSPRCPPGYVATATSFCQPNGGSCAATSTCTSDAECDPYSEKPVCAKSRGFCVATCLFDFQRGTSDCPPEQVCHVVESLLTGDNLNFGGGKCGPPCVGANPFVCGGDLTCVADGDPVLVAQPLPKRCRPTPPKCVREADCPASPDTHSRGFCNRDTLECEAGCRKESDCEGGYKCSAGQCVEKTCIEGGGAAISCNRGFLLLRRGEQLRPVPDRRLPGPVLRGPQASVVRRVRDERRGDLVPRRLLAAAPLVLLGDRRRQPPVALLRSREARDVPARPRLRALRLLLRHQRRLRPRWHLRRREQRPRHLQVLLLQQRRDLPPALPAT